MTDATFNLRSNTPEPYAPALIRLLQGVVYSDDRDIWELIMRYQSAIHTHFGQMGVLLYLDESNGFAYLTQPDSEDGDVATTLPRLTRRRELTYSTTLVLVLLREALNQFDSNVSDNRYLTIAHEDLIRLISPFYVVREDERSLNRQMEKDINQVVDLGFLKKYELNGQINYNVRPILKARVNSDELARLKNLLEQHAHDESNQSN